MEQSQCAFLHQQEVVVVSDAALRANASARSVFANIFMSQINHVVRVRTKDLWSREQKTWFDLGFGAIEDYY